jgi:antitoxin PrlF
MKENIIVSDRGQITLPAAMRKLLGLTRSAVVTAEHVGGKIVLTPAMVVETETYPDKQIADWDRADTFRKGEHAALLVRLNKRRV